MRRAVIVVIASLVACIGRVQSVGAQPGFLVLEDARRSLAAVAGTLPTFNADEYIYDRERRPDGWSRLVGANYDSETLAALLGDTRPRVRTLAMALLFSRKDPKLLMPVAFHSTYPTLMRRSPSCYRPIMRTHGQRHRRASAILQDKCWARTCLPLA